MLIKYIVYLILSNVMFAKIITTALFLINAAIQVIVSEDRALDHVFLQTCEQAPSIAHTLQLKCEKGV